jgi:hypothetical protein
MLVYSVGDTFTLDFSSMLEFLIMSNSIYEDRYDLVEVYDTDKCYDDDDKTAALLDIVTNGTSHYVVAVIDPNVFITPQH